MKFSVITALSLSALTLAAPIEQAVPEKIAAVNSADAASGSQWQWQRLFGGKAKSQKPISPFAIAKAAFIGARLGAVSGTKYTGAKAFFGAKYGALKGVSKGLRSLRGGRRPGGFGQRPRGGLAPRPYGGMGGLPGRRPSQFGGKGGAPGYGGKGGFGGGYRRDAQQLEGPEEMTAPQMFGQEQEPPVPWANYAPEQADAPEDAEGPEAGDEMDAPEEFSPEGPPPSPSQAFQEPFNERFVDDQISRALADAELPAGSEGEADADASPAPALPAVDAPVVPVQAPVAA